jgi:hypothetical protein
MADLDTQEKQLLDDIREYFIASLGVTLTDEQLLEVKQSFSHLGRALVLWQEQQNHENPTIN